MEQIRDVLKEVLKEELTPITIRLDEMGNRLDGMDNRLDEMGNQLNSMEGRVTSVENQMTSMQEQLNRLEHNQTEDVVLMLQVIDKKLSTHTDLHKHKINVLNERLLVAEADIHKLKTTLSVS